MTRALAAAPAAFFSFVAMLMLASLTIWAGLVPNDTISLWAGAIIAGDGELSLGRIVAAYPTIPFLATSGLEAIVPTGSPTPALLAAALAGLLAGMWFLALRAAGAQLGAAAGITALLIFHPALLRAVIAGPSEVLLALFLFLFGYGLFDLRARGSAPDVMLVALAMLALAFSHPVGAAIVCAAVPFLVFAVRPALVANSAINVVIPLVFPTVFSVGAFVYVSWVFPGSGWSFYSAPAQSLSDWAAGIAMFGGGLTGFDALDAAFAFTAAIGIAAPLAALTLWRVRHRLPLIAPAAVLAAAAITAAAISVGTGWFGEPAPLAVIAPVLAALVVVRIPLAREGSRRLFTLLTLGWIGGALALVLVDPRLITQAARAAGGDNDRLAALELGLAVTNRSGVLVDTDNAPAIVVGRGDARGLLSPADDRFALALLLGRLDAPFVAVPDPHSAAGTDDRINRNFPALYRHGARGYRLIYQNKSWRLYGKEQ